MGKHVTDEETPGRTEILEKADSHLHDTNLTLEEYEELTDAISELAPLFRHEIAYFVLGSYGREEIRRLRLVKDRLNRRPNAYAFLMVDVRGEWANVVLKFRLLGDYADRIVGVAEHDRSGFLVEQGLFIAESDYFEKTHVLKRVAEAVDSYNWMQESVFELLDREGRLCRWSDERSLVECVRTVP